MTKKIDLIQIGHKEPFPFSGFGTGTAGEMPFTTLVASALVTKLLARGRDPRVVPSAFDFSMKADTFISLHCDGSNNPSVRGYSIGFHDLLANMPRSRDLAKRLSQLYGEKTGLSSRGFNITRDMSRYYAFKRLSHVPASILLEMGFLTNPEEAKFLRENVDLIAETIATAIAGEKMEDRLPREEEEELRYLRGQYKKSGNWLINIDDQNNPTAQFKRKFIEYQDTGAVYHNPLPAYRIFENGNKAHGFKGGEPEEYIEIRDIFNRLRWTSPEGDGFSIAGVKGAEIVSRGLNEVKGWGEGLTLVIPYIYL